MKGYRENGINADIHLKDPISCVPNPVKTSNIYRLNAFPTPVTQLKIYCMSFTMKIYCLNYTFDHFFTSFVAICKFLSINLINMHGLKDSCLTL